MICTKCYRMHLYPTDNQKRVLDNTFNGMRFVYNKILEYKIHSYLETQGSQVLDLSIHELIDLYGWLKTIPKHILYQAKYEINQKFDHFLQHRFKETFPHYHKKDANVPLNYIDQSFTYAKFALNEYDQPLLALPRLGFVRIYKSAYDKICDFKEKNHLSNVEFVLHYMKFTKSIRGEYFVTLVYRYENHIVNEYYPLYQRFRNLFYQEKINVVAIDDVHPHNRTLFSQDSDKHIIGIPSKMIKIANKLHYMIQKYKHMIMHSNHSKRSIYQINCKIEQLKSMQYSFLHDISNYYGNTYDICFLWMDNVFHNKYPFKTMHLHFRKELRQRMINKHSDILQFSILNYVRCQNRTDILFELGCKQYRLERSYGLL